MTVAPNGSGISRDEWLQALTAAGVPMVDDQAALTIYEFMALFQMNRSTATHRLDRLVETGQATKTWKRATRQDGKVQQLRAWRLATPAKAKRRR